MKSDCACSGYSSRSGNTNVLDGDSGSGERWIVASSSAGGFAEARTMMPRARIAAARTLFSLSRRDSVSLRVASLAAMAAARASIFERRALKEGVWGERARPRVHASRASGILERASKASEER